MNEHQNVGSGVGSADADVVQVAGQAQGEAAGVFDAVAAYAVVGVGAFAGLGFGPVAVGGGWGGLVRQGAVRAVMVVFLDEGIELGL
ncbi:hypothetical protein LAUMK191_05633 [Mycobacterium attenuatum]|nr:hypothetical protein LAUMK191_05633 [Mycobacterium attenuatum]